MAVGRLSLLSLVVGGLLLVGCQSVSGLDPTEDTFAVSLRNDSGMAVVVKQCDVKCDSYHEQDHLNPGGQVEVNTSSSNVANWWVVTTTSGSSVGCVNLQYDHKQTGVVVNLSKTQACPK